MATCRQLQKFFLAELERNAARNERRPSWGVTESASCLCRSVVKLRKLRTSCTTDSCVSPHKMNSRVGSRRPAKFKLKRAIFAFDYLYFSLFSRTSQCLVFLSLTRFRGPSKSHFGKCGTILSQTNKLRTRRVESV